MPMAKTTINEKEKLEALFKHFNERYGVKATTLWEHRDGTVTFEYELKPKEDIK